MLETSVGSIAVGVLSKRVLFRARVSSSSTKQ